MTEAMAIMEAPGAEGYMVHFEWAENGMLRTDYFPDKHSGEELIRTKGEAWTLAMAFAAKTKGKCVNIYVVDEKWRPVPDYKESAIANR